MASRPGSKEPCRAHPDGGDAHAEVVLTVGRCAKVIRLTAQRAKVVLAAMRCVKVVWAVRCSAANNYV